MLDKDSTIWSKSFSGKRLILPGRYYQQIQTVNFVDGRSNILNWLVYYNDATLVPVSL